MGEMRRRSFVEQVRVGELKAPTQPGFKLERWSNAFSAIESPSVSEQRLYDSGVWFAQRGKLSSKEQVCLLRNRDVFCH